MEAVYSAGAIDINKLVDALLDGSLSLFEFLLIGMNGARFLVGKVVGNGCWNHKIAVSQALHERRGAQAVGSVL